MPPLRVHLVMLFGLPVLCGASQHMVGLEWRAHAIGSALGTMVPRAAPPAVEVTVLEEELQPVLVATSPLGDEGDGREQAKPARGGRRAKPRAVHIDASTVLRLASRGSAPTGRLVPATAARPAGLRVFGVGAYGVGLVDGDVLVEVDGLPVAGSGEVVAAVIGARARRRPVMTGKLYRGRDPILLTVEMPYPDARVGRAPASGAPGGGPPGQR